MLRFATIRRPVLALLLLPLALTGCLHVEQTLSLQPDGSGTLHVRYGMTEANVAQMQSMAAAAGVEKGSDMPFDFNEKQVREDLAQHEKDGVRLASFRTEVVEGWKYMDLAITFENLAGLTRTQFLPRKGLSLKALGGGRYEWRQTAGHLGAPPIEGADPAAVEQMMAEMMKGFRAELRIEVPGDIIESTADEVKGRTAIWRLDLDKDPATLKRARELDMKVIFQGEALKLAEIGAPSR